MLKIIEMVRLYLLTPSIDITIAITEINSDIKEITKLNKNRVILFKKSLFDKSS